MHSGGLGVGSGQRRRIRWLERKQAWLQQVRGHSGVDTV